MPRKSPTRKQEAWLERYLGNGFNSAEAARFAGYKHPEQRGYENVRKSYIRPLIEERMSELAMSAAETLARISMHARSDDPHISIRALEMLGKAHALFKDRLEVASSWETEAWQKGWTEDETRELYEDMVQDYESTISRHTARVQARRENGR